MKARVLLQASAGGFYRLAIMRGGGMAPSYQGFYTLKRTSPSIISWEKPRHTQSPKKCTLHGLFRATA